MPEDPLDAEERELEERLKKLLGEGASVDVPVPAPSEEIELDEIEAKAEALKANLHTGDLPDVPEWNYERKRTADQASSPADYRNLGRGLQLAYVLIGMPLVGFGAGWLVDRFTGFSSGKAIGAMLGFALAIYYVVKTTQEER